MSMTSLPWSKTLLAVLVIFLGCAPRQALMTRTRLLMGHVPVTVQIKITPEKRAGSLEIAEGVFRLAEDLEKQISEWRKNSEITCLNKNAGKKPCPVSISTLSLLQAAQRISAQTDNAFDIRFASPTSEARSGKILLNEEKLLAKLEHSQTRIGIGAIGKGWIVDQMAEYLRRQGVSEFLITAGGDLRAGGGPWKIGIQVPGRSPGKFTGEWQIYNESWATSGIYEQGPHILNPNTGKPVLREASVTVRSPLLALSDALATAFFVLGEKDTERILKRFSSIQVIWTDPDGVTRTYPK